MNRALSLRRDKCRARASPYRDYSTWRGKTLSKRVNCSSRKVSRAKWKKKESNENFSVVTRHENARHGDNGVKCGKEATRERKERVVGIAQADEEAARALAPVNAKKGEDDIGVRRATYFRIFSTLSSAAGNLKPGSLSKRCHLLLRSRLLAHKSISAELCAGKKLIY